MMDYLFRGDLADFDPDLAGLIHLESERQYRKLIMIPSESSAPLAVREALSSSFQNIYAEGYPPENTRLLKEDEIFDYGNRLAHFRRYSDPRYYKGVEYVNIVEALARRRCAELFANEILGPDDLFVNVQALSGGPANNAVYHALVKPGETVMGMSLLHGGHLSHGSRANRSGKYYNIVSYSVDPDTELLDYEGFGALAREHQPKMIIAGVSSYPWSLDWERFRTIADEVDAYLLADISHVAGLIAAGVYPSPIGYADVITSTTHKTLCGPRGAIIITADSLLSRKLDRAVFPGEQGGPHVNVFAAMALAFKLARTDKFKKMQEQVVENCKTLTNRLSELGMRIAYGGTNTHLMNLDVRTIKGKDGAWLTGDLAARILDIVGIVTNRNTIPGDISALRPSGVRIGTSWVTQRGLGKAEMNQIADVIVDVLTAAKPYYQGRSLRAKVDYSVLENAKCRIRDLALGAGLDFESPSHGYPHFYYRDDERQGDWTTLTIYGERVRQFLNVVLSCDIEYLSPGEFQVTFLETPEGVVKGTIVNQTSDEFGLVVSSSQAGLVASWLRDLSDGYIVVDDDLLRKIPGPVIVAETSTEVYKQELINTADDSFARNITKPYYIGIQDSSAEPLPDFKWDEKPTDIKRTPIYDLHVELGGKMVPFAGWEMPVRYASVMEEHLAVREAAGLFDVAHMGVYQAEGPDSAVFLDSVCGNDVSALAVGESLYTHFLDPDANVIDDLLVYRRASRKYMIVVNAANDDKDWAWLNAVRNGTVKVDNKRPWTRAFGRNVILRNLRDPKEGPDMRVDIALQGPRSRDILLSLGVDDGDRKGILKLKRTELREAVVGGFDLVVSRTGYTGERMAFELFVHPEQAQDLFRLLLQNGEPFGLRVIGLGARDSLRTEAGLPLYGHEMGGSLNLGVSEAAFGSYVKTYKPWFVGRDAYLVQDSNRRGVVVRFRFNEKGVRMAHLGDPVVDRRGKMIGTVTSCAADRNGFLVGQAYLDLKSSDEGTTIYIFQGAAKNAGKAPVDLDFGDRISIPSAATVLRRFPK